ncbi:PREDICTED: tumor necrosis factor ligand superfamily member 14 [Haliaeetus leucocephalus]|uniref:tumor necrosis factor ligand superfamily member 14 n=1 Tax=Haliaeetus leucocephalus TaxID=52644 RepID=UPI00053CC372|nr:PREDICTED: tumor necrosis factor ligand superfamily member 14 [Haliaeetus leucocephalus]
MGDGVFALAGPWPPLPPPRAPTGAAPPPVPAWRRRVRGGAWGRWVLGTLVALALVAVAVQGWVLAGVRGELQRVTARLQIAGADVSSQPNGSLRWEPGKSWAFIRGLGYRGGSLVCRQPGLYFVYAKVQLGAPGCPARAATLHGIHKRTPRYPGVLDLLVNKVVYCPQAHQVPWARNSFLGGLVRLETGDEVFTQVQAPELVRAVDGTRSYFGMFMV